MIILEKRGPEKEESLSELKMVEINDSQFSTIVLRSSLPVLLECARPECIICKTMAERIREAGRDHLGRMIFLRLNINESAKWQEFDVKVVPTLLYFKEGLLVAKQEKFPDVEEIRSQILAVVKPGRPG